MIYIVQVLTPWVSSADWQSLGAFSDPHEAKLAASWLRDPASVRVVEIPAVGKLKDLLET